MELRTLVTGGSGFVGINLVEALRRSGRTLLSLGMRETPPPAQESVYRRIDILDRRAVVAAFDAFQPQEVIHLAARTDFAGRQDFHGWSVNTLGTANVVAAIAATPQVRRALFASSIVAANAPAQRAEYGYARSKAAMEAIVGESALGARGCAWALLRLCHVWGPWGGAPYRGFFLAIARGRYLTLGEADAPKRLAYVGNVAHQIERLLDAPAGRIQGRLFYLADDPPLRVGEWARMIAEAVGRRAPRRLPEPLVHIAAGCGDALTLAGWRNPPINSRRLANMRTPSPPIPLALTLDVVGPSPYDVRFGIDATIEWLRAEKLVSRTSS